MKHICSILICLTALSACTLGNLHNNQSISEVNSQAQASSIIRRGMTMDQVRSEWGGPFERQVLGGRTTWTYQTSSRSFDGTAVLAGVLGGCLSPLKLCHYLLTNGVTENGTETIFG